MQSSIINTIPLIQSATIRSTQKNTNSREKSPVRISTLGDSLLQGPPPGQHLERSLKLELQVSENLEQVHRQLNHADSLRYVIL